MDRILVLRRCQVVDPQRGTFYVGLEPDGRAQHLGHQVYKDSFGRRLIIVDDGRGRGVAGAVHEVFKGSLVERLVGELVGSWRTAVSH